MSSSHTHVFCVLWWHHHQYSWFYIGWRLFPRSSIRWSPQHVKHNHWTTFYSLTQIWMYPSSLDNHIHNIGGKNETLPTVLSQGPSHLSKHNANGIPGVCTMNLFQIWPRKLQIRSRAISAQGCLPPRNTCVWPHKGLTLSEMEDMVFHLHAPWQCALFLDAVAPRWTFLRVSSYSPSYEEILVHLI